MIGALHRSPQEGTGSGAFDAMEKVSLAEMVR